MQVIVCMFSWSEELIKISNCLRPRLTSFSTSKVGSNSCYWGMQEKIKIAPEGKLGAA